MGCFVLFCAVIISAFLTVCKKLFPLGPHDRAADLPQAHFRNVAGGDTKGVDGGRRVELIDVVKFIGRKILIRPQTQPGQQHIRHADLQGLPVEHRQVKIVQFLQQAVLSAVVQVLQVVCDVVRHGVAAGGAHRIHKIIFFGKVAKGGFQRFNDLRRKRRVHRPDRQRAGEAGRMSVRNVKIELQTVLPIIPEYRNALGPSVDPAAKLPVPALHFKDSGSVRALGVDQDLLVKGAFIVIAGGTEKSCPALVAASDAPHGLIIQLCDELKLGGQLGTSYLSGSVLFFAGSQSLFCRSWRAFSNGSRW